MVPKGPVIIAHLGQVLIYLGPILSHKKVKSLFRLKLPFGFFENTDPGVIF